MKEECIQDCGNNIIKGMCPRGDPKASRGKEAGKVDPSYCPKTKGGPRELTALGKLSINEHKVMMGTEQARWNKDREDNGKGVT